MRQKNQRFRHGVVSTSNGDKWHWFDNRIKDLAMQILSDAPASRISRSLAEIRLKSIDRVLYLQAEMEEGHKLQAAGDQSGKARARSAWAALGEESDGALLLDRLLKGLCADLNLGTRCRLEEIAKMNTPVMEQSEEEVRKELQISIDAMILEKAQIFPMPVPPEVQHAAAALGIKLAIDAPKTSDATDS